MWKNEHCLQQSFSVDALEEEGKLTLGLADWQWQLKQVADEY